MENLIIITGIDKTTNEVTETVYAKKTDIKEAELLKDELLEELEDDGVKSYIMAKMNLQTIDIILKED